MSKSQSGDSYGSGGKWYLFQVEEENVHRQIGQREQSMPRWDGKAGGWGFG